MESILQVVKKETSAKIAVLIFLLFTVFWISLFLFEKDSVAHAIYGSTYGILALWGGIVGLKISGRWGGHKSVLGKAILFFSFGLLAQFFGQVAYTIYIYFLKIELPYPSLGDVGYFGSIPIYIYAVLMLAKASGVRLSRQPFQKKVLAMVTPVVILLISYLLLLSGYEFNWSAPLVIFLDFGYPFGQAIYISLAILTYTLSKNILGGIMRTKILFILFALFVQYLSDYSFLYLVKNELWFVGGINDYIYLVSYLLMSLGLIQLKTVFDDLRRK
ncbi:TPA: hypothetical protein DIV55_00860 [Patescibacteria group bacterium]|uniref:Uncharacterized protein n=1 Tax=Candidatus Gottesmanbacteria bacterium GW2011_GWA1_43_11 TaxID=1618436 RepID=A0A0G1CFR0_9BACT|nr:MAG: hypothetical protein UV59_C0022G0019 [Candidatus Gottesmanbacteria bacterium GW2011_GWA1_43_11]HCS78275.1 hypothetical protein [Patescibacteria group bacterium]